MAWQAVAPAPFSEVTGEVVWNKSRNEGLMIFQGLPVNDPKVAQYQLWIVDPSRDERPVDGGVFNVTASGRIIVPVNQKLSITDPKAFVITREKPGGVVVSAGPFLLKADVP
jgi:anti-sigma-K factor RskA